MLFFNSKYLLILFREVENKLPLVEIGILPTRFRSIGTPLDKSTIIDRTSCIFHRELSTGRGPGASIPPKFIAAILEFPVDRKALKLNKFYVKWVLSRADYLSTGLI